MEKILRGMSRENLPRFSYSFLRDGSIEGPPDTRLVPLGHHTSLYMVPRGLRGCSQSGRALYAVDRRKPLGQLVCFFPKFFGSARLSGETISPFLLLFWRILFSSSNEEFSVKNFPVNAEWKMFLQTFWWRIADKSWKLLAYVWIEFIFCEKKIVTWPIKIICEKKFASDPY